MTNFHQPNKFAFLSGPQAAAFGVFTAPRALTSGPLDPKLRERENHSANLALKQHLTGPRLWRAASRRDLARGPFTIQGELQEIKKEG